MDLRFLSMLPQWTVHDDLGFVDGLLAQVIGKTEKAKKLPPGTISSWSFKAHPWLCPTRHLLILIRIVGHVSVYFLMNHENLVEVGADPDQDNSVTEQTSHTNFLVGLRCFCRSGSTGHICIPSTLAIITSYIAFGRMDVVTSRDGRNRTNDLLSLLGFT